MKPQCVGLMLLVCASACDSGAGSGTTNGAAGAGTGGPAAAGRSPASDVTPLDTGLDTSRPLNGLSEPELEQLCKAFDAFYETLIDNEELARRLCALESVLDSYVVQPDGSRQLHVPACEAATQACLVTGPVTMRPPCEQLALQQSVGTCSATVGEWEACTTVLLAASAEQEISCAQYAKLLAMTVPLDPNEVGLAAYPECAAVEETCVSM